MKPRILIFSVAYPPFIGGAEIAVKEITDRLPQFDFDMLTVNLDGQQKQFERLGNVNVYRLGRGQSAKYFFPWTAFRLGRRLHKKNPYQAIWAIMANYAGLAAVKFKRRFGEVPFLLTLQEGDDLKATERKVWFIKSWWRDIFRRADYVQAISNSLADWASRMGARCPIEVVPNGVDIAKLKAKSYKLKASPVIITTSRLVKKNGIGDLLEAMRYLPDNIKLIIVGDGPEAKTLKAKSYKLEARVNLVGAVPPEQIPEYLAKADIFVRPSLSEGLGNSFLEAMAAGLPVVGTPVGGILDFLYGEQGRTIGQEQTGWFCRVNDPQSIAEKVKYILDPANAATVDEVVKNARKLVEQKYDWPKIAAQLGRILGHLS